jgi:hypothetical protein
MSLVSAKPLNVDSVLAWKVFVPKGLLFRAWLGPEIYAGNEVVHHAEWSPSSQRFQIKQSEVGFHAFMEKAEAEKWAGEDGVAVQVELSGELVAGESRIWGAGRAVRGHSMRILA